MEELENATEATHEGEGVASEPGTENTETNETPDKGKPARERKPVKRTAAGRARMIRKSLKAVNEHVDALRQSGWNVEVLVDGDGMFTVEITREAQVVSL